MMRLNVSPCDCGSRVVDECGYCGRCGFWRYPVDRFGMRSGNPHGPARAEAHLAKLRALCVAKGFSEDDADLFVAATRTLGRGAAFGEGTVADLLDAYAVMDRLIEKYPEIQR